MVEIHEDGTETKLPPRQDVNAPDMYIPTMAVFTYILILGFMAGTKGQFSPQVISSSLSFCLVAIVLEVFVLLCSYLASCSSSCVVLN